MVAMVMCFNCSTGSELFGVFTKQAPTHCHGNADNVRKGVLGGSMCPCPCRYKPYELHRMASLQHPNDKDAAGRRYIELMKEAGHIIPREPGDDSPLFSCGYDPRPERTG